MNALANGVSQIQKKIALAQINYANSTKTIPSAAQEPALVRQMNANATHSLIQFNVQMEKSVVL